MKRIGQGAWQAAAVTAGAAVLLALLAQPVSARPRVCSQLEAQLAATGSGGGGSAQFKKYDRAVATQRDQLSIARSRARRAGCGFSFLSVGPAMCAPLNAQIERMERNLEALERKRVALSSSGSSTRDRARIMASLDANNCRDTEVAARQPARGDGSNLFERLFGGGVPEGLPAEDIERQPFGEREPIDGRQPVEENPGPANVTRILNPNGEVSVLGPAGEFSTMCVRTCDGYYFPMSPNSSSADFERDLKNCESTCPGTEMQLYYQHAVGDESETMVSAGTGEPYSSLPTAYLYRDATLSRPQSCGCNPVKNFSILGGATAQPAEPVEPATPMPVVRPDPADDPETAANRQGGLDLETIKRILKPKPATPPVTATGERRIRVVGPVFLPDPKGAIDLKAPARKQVQ
jgi:hypothetical protein